MNTPSTVFVETYVSHQGKDITAEGFANNTLIKRMDIPVVNATEAGDIVGYLHHHEALQQMLEVLNLYLHGNGQLEVHARCSRTNGTVYRVYWIITNW
jgi:hypothetical protein